MTTKSLAIPPKPIYIDQAPLVASTMETKTLRKVEQLTKPDEYGYILVRPYGQASVNVHSRWIRSKPAGF